MRLKETRALFQAGRYVDALSLLDSGTPFVSERVETEVLKIELSERLGEHAKGRHMADRALRARSLPLQFKADCHFAIAQMDAEDGCVDRAIERFNEALALARQAKDPYRICWIQMRLMHASCGLISREASGPVIAATRLEVRRLGDARALAALHLFVAQVAAKHGALGTARRHTRVGLTLLESAPNLWLRALGENNLLALAIMACDIDTGLRHARAGLQAAEMSGAATVKRALIGNLGNLYSLQGAWKEAQIQFRETTSGHQATVEAEHGTLESLARLHLLEDQLDAARE